MEFYNLGKHCSLDICKQQDFLPFKCDLCQHHFCSAHRAYDDHKCAKYEAKDLSTTVPICSHCHVPVAKQYPTEAASTALARHYQQACLVLNPALKNKIKPKSAHKCASAKCNQDSITTCKQCNKQYCLDHIIETDHKCVKSSNKISLTGSLHLDKQVRLFQQVTTVKNTESKHVADLKQYFLKLRKPNEPLAFTNTPQTAICPLYKPNLEKQDAFSLRLFFPMNSNAHAVHIVVPKIWSVGRLLDVLAERAQLSNKNHLLPASSVERLQLYLLTSGKLGLQPLPNSASLEHLSQQGLLRSGDCIIMERGADGTLLRKDAILQLQMAIQSQAKKDESLKQVYSKLVSINV